MDIEEKTKIMELALKYCPANYEQGYKTIINLIKHYEPRPEKEAELYKKIKRLIEESEK